MIWSKRKLGRIKSFEQIRVRLLSDWLPESDKSGIAIGFTSRRVGEGVTTVTDGLASAFGRHAPQGVLRLDVSPIKASLFSANKERAKRVDINTMNGSDFYVSEHTRLDNVLGIDTLGILPHRNSVQNQVFTKHLMTQLRKVYRVVLVDCGALSDATTANWLNHCDYKVMVIDTSITTQEILEAQRKSLSHSRIELDGTILNKRRYPIPKMLYWLTH